MLGTRTKNNFKVVISQEGQPSRLPSVQNASCGQVDEVLVIGHHLDPVLGAHQVRTLFYKGGYNGREFFVINWVVDLGGVNFLE